MPARLQTRRAAVIGLVVLAMFVVVPAADANPAGDLWGWGTGLSSATRREASPATGSAH